MHNTKKLKQFKKLEGCYYVVDYLLMIIETGGVQSVGVFLREPKTYLDKDIQDSKKTTENSERLDRWMR